MSDAMDDLFAQIDQTAKKLETAQQNPAKKTGTGGKKGTFKNVEMTFLGAVMGQYEMRLFADDDNKLFEDIHIHTIKNGAAKITLPCIGENCSICSLRKKLEELQSKHLPKAKHSAWKFSPYKMIKILVKIGESQAKGATAGTVYVAYVDEKFFKPLLDSLMTSKKYYPESIGKMLQGTEVSPGFAVTASRSNKKTIYNFNFVDPLKITAIDKKEVFGTSCKLVNLGYFRTNFVNADKLKQAESILNGLILATIDTASNTAAAKAAAATPTDTPAAKVADPVIEKVVDKPVDEIKVATTTTIDPSTIIIDPKDLGADGNPKCFSYFDPNSKKCSSECQFKGSCLMKTMEEGRI